MRQCEKRSGGGACRQRLGNHLGDGGAGAGCPSVPSGRTASVESGIGGLLGGSKTVCCSSLRAVSFGCGRRLLGSFGVFSGGIVGAASGNSSAITPGPLGSFSDSTQRKKVSFSSSIAAHPARPKLVDRAIITSTTRAQARISGGFGGGSFGYGAYGLGVEG